MSSTPRNSDQQYGRAGAARILAGAYLRLLRNPATNPPTTAQLAAPEDSSESSTNSLGFGPERSMKCHGQGGLSPNNPLDRKDL